MLRQTLEALLQVVAMNLLAIPRYRQRGSFGVVAGSNKSVA